MVLPIISGLHLVICRLITRAGDRKAVIPRPRPSCGRERFRHSYDGRLSRQPSLRSPIRHRRQWRTPSVDRVPSTLGRALRMRSSGSLICRRAGGQDLIMSAVRAGSRGTCSARGSQARRFGEAPLGGEGQNQAREVTHPSRTQERLPGMAVRLHSRRPRSTIPCKK